MRRLAFALVLVAAACSKKKEEPPASAPAPASDAGTGTVTVTASDAGTAAAAAAATDAGAAAATDAAAPAPAGAFHLVDHVGEPVLILAPPELAGTRMTLYSATGRVCDVTVGGPARTSYVAATVTAAEGDCADALFAVAAGRKVELVALTAAKDWEGEAMAAYEETSDFSNAEMKSDLEGGPGGKTISARRLVARSGPSLALVYASLAGERSIGVFSVPDAASFAGAVYNDTVRAPAPSTVVGVDADGDGALDVVIGHGDGVALIPARGEVVQVIEGGVRDW